jgi:hypothetical protein
MALPTDHVQPGDLIRADLLNTLIDFVAELNDRVLVLEANVPPPADHSVQIITISPGSPRIGDQMTITGRNFDYSVRAAAVRFDNTVVPQFLPASSDTQLVFTVPSIPGIVDNPREVLMRVTNFDTDATRKITVQPRVQIFQGNIDLRFVSATPSPIAAGQNALIRYTAQSTGTPAVTLVLSATVSTGWTGIAFLDESQQPLPSNLITVPALGTKTFLVRVPVPAGTADATKFTLDLQASGQGAESSRLTPMFVGKDAPTKDTDINLEFRGIMNAVLDGSLVRVPAGAQGQLTLDAQFKQIGQYDLTVSLDPATSSWKAGTDAPVPTPNKPSYQVDAGDIQPDGWSHNTVLVGAKASATKGDTADLHVVAKRRGATVQTEAVYQLVVV